MSALAEHLVQRLLETGFWDRLRSRTFTAAKRSSTQHAWVTLVLCDFGLWAWDKTCPVPRLHVGDGGAFCGSDKWFDHSVREAYGTRLNNAAQPNNVNRHRLSSRINTPLDSRLALRIKRYRWSNGRSHLCFRCAVGRPHANCPGRLPQ